MEYTARGEMPALEGAFLADLATLAGHLRWGSSSPKRLVGCMAIVPYQQRCVSFVVFLSQLTLLHGVRQGGNELV